MTMTPLADFLTALWETGQVAVPELSPGGKSDISPADVTEATLRLHCYASDERTALPGVPPTVDAAAAMWGLTAMFAACSLIVHRQQTVEMFASQFDSQQLDSSSSNVVYSVDLALRFLPDVHRLATKLSESDPLCDVLEELGRRWPLSSVGMSFREPQETSAVDTAAWWSDDCLRQVYLDRIIEREDFMRLHESCVADSLRAVIGIHDDLSPKISSALKTKTVALTAPSAD